MENLGEARIIFLTSFNSSKSKMKIKQERDHSRTSVAKTSDILFLQIAHFRSIIRY